MTSAIRSFKIVYRQALAECPLMHGNMKKETDTEIDKCIYQTLGGCVTPAGIQKQITLLMTVNSIPQSLPSNYLKDLNFK